MIWRWGKRLNLLQLHSHRVMRLQFLSSHNLSSPIQCCSNKHQNSNVSINTREPLPGCKTILTPQIVRITLLNCPSDLIALSFFLWCARQPNYFHERPVFQHMVSVVARLTERFQTVKRIVKELEHAGFVTKAQTFLLLLRIYWCGGMHDLVFETFEQMVHHGYTPNTFSRNILMDGLFKIDRVEVALRVLKENQVPNFLSFSIAICNLCKLNDLVNIKDVLRIMLRKGYYLNAETFEVVLSCYCKLGRPAEALQVLGLMITLGIQVSVTIWSMLIDAYCKSSRLDIACSLLVKMVESGYFPNVVTYTSLIKGFLESQMPNKAFGLLNIMESKGCQPDLVLCNVLIDCLSKIGRFEDAFDVFFSLQERKLTPDAYSLSSVLSAVCLSRQFVLFPIFLNGVTVQPDLVACNSLLSYFARAGYLPGTVEFFFDMIDRGYTPDKYSFAGLLSALCKLGKTDEAVNVYDHIIQNHSGVDAHIHTVIISGLIKSGNSSRAIGLFKKAAVNFPLDIVSYTVAINGLLRNRQVGEAYNLFTQMKEIGISPNQRIYNMMLSGFCKHWDAKMVEQILQEMVDDGMEMNSTTFRILKNLPYKLCHSYSVFNMFTKLCESGVFPTECAVLRNRLISGSCFSNAVDVTDVDARSDELYDAAGSIS